METAYLFIAKSLNMQQITLLRNTQNTSPCCMLPNEQTNPYAADAASLYLKS